MLEENNNKDNKETTENTVNKILESDHFESNLTSMNQSKQENKQNKQAQGNIAPKETQIIDLQEPEEEIVFETDCEQESEKSDKEPEEVHVRATRVCKPAIQMNIADTKGKSYVNVSFKD